MRLPSIEKPLRIDQVQDYGYRMKNILRNPNFDIWQRGNTFTGPTGLYAHTADEWWIECNDPVTVSLSSPAGRIGNYSAKIDWTKSGPSQCSLTQGVENYKELEGLYLTFSISVKSDVSCTAFIVDAKSPSDVEIGWSTNHQGDGQWHRLTALKQIRTGLVPYPLVYRHAYPIWMGVIVNTTSHDTYIDGASCVVGNFPEGVPFVPSNPQDELNRCMRYYQKYVSVQIGQYLPAGGSNVQSMPMSVPMAPGAVRNILAQTLNGNLSSASLVLDMNGSQSLKATVTDAGGAGGGGTVGWDYELKVP